MSARMAPYAPRKPYARTPPATVSAHGHGLCGGPALRRSRAAARRARERKERKERVSLEATHRRIVNLRDQLIPELILIFNRRDARGKVGVLLEALAKRERSDVPKARDLQVDEVRAAAQDSALREAKLCEHAKGEPVDEHVRRREQVPQPLAAVGSRQLDSERLLAVVSLGVEELAARAVLRDDLDDSGAVVRERAPDDGAGDDVRKVNDHHVGERPSRPLG